ncbi:hypothetical protein [Yinghuangia soli]|uniref:Asp23/Gls24 family envelope stress response protein n=1 Tax=Yinghuangia soli TaxID=2908204 RepID=A0AA41U4K9_9ACTN|nr:hypothetical protein [Yinghuangia soli]MCF2533041.1 hypothetical protein [Yinghuangia soli]
MGRTEASDDAATAMPTAAELLAAGSMPTATALLAATAASPAAGTAPAKDAHSPAAPAAKRGGLAGLEAALGLGEAPESRALREAADAEPGVRSRSCLVRTDEKSGTTTVIVSIAVAYGIALHAAADRVRARIAKAAPKVLGAPADSIQVDVKIVWLDEPAQT